MQLPRVHTITTHLLKPSFRRVAAGVLVVMLAGLVAGWLLPRGPVTVPAALLDLMVALAMGLGAGWLARSAWILLNAPVVFMLLFELARI